MPTIISRLQALLKQTERYKQRAIKSLQKTMRKIEAERKARTADLDEAAKIISKQLADLGWTGNAKPRGPRGKAKATTTTRKSGKKRIRRSPEQLKTEATKVVAFIRSSGKNGVGGGEIRKHFPGVGQNIKGFVKQYTGETLKTTGQKASMKYRHE